MSVFERKRLLAGLLKIELEIAAVTNGCLIIYSPDVDAYLAIPQSVFGIETDLEAQMLMETSLVSPDIVLPVGAYGVDELFTDGLLSFATTSQAGGVLKIPYVICDGCATPVSGNRLKRLEGIVTSILDIGSTVGKRRAQARQSGENYITVTCDDTVVSTTHYTVTENEAGGLTYTITATGYEEEDGIYRIGGSDGG